MLFKFPPKLGSRTAIFKYLEADLFAWMRDLSVGLLKMNFTENFDSFRVDNLVINAGQEVSIGNLLKPKSNNIIPNAWIIVRQGKTDEIGNTGNGFVTEGVTPWTADLVYLFNHGPEDTMISVIFFK